MGMRMAKNAIFRGGNTVPLVVAEFLGLLIVIVGAAWLLSLGAEVLAEKYGANFAGSILLALVTTLPEYLFVYWAATKGNYEMALGSVVGACTLLVTLGYGSVILFSTTRVSKKPVQAIILSKATRIDAIYLFVTAVLAFILAWEGNGLDLKDAIILSAVFFIYVVEHYRTARRVSMTIEHDVTTARMWKAIAMLVAGGVVIVLASEYFVDSMVEIAHILGVSPMAVAIVLSPIASELPEKITAYLTVIRDGKLAEISICNFMGSKVNHNSLLLAVLPFVGLTAGKGNIPGVISVPFAIMTALTLVAGVSLSRNRLSRWQGWFFLSLYLTTIAAAYAVR
jgi:cation:H+ antiporter